METVPGDELVILTLPPNANLVIAQNLAKLSLQFHKKSFCLEGPKNQVYYENMNFP